MKRHQGFEVFYKFIDWHCLSLGVHLDILGPRLEIHIPFGWIRIGWNRDTGRGMWGWEDGLLQIIPWNGWSRRIDEENKDLSTEG